MQLSATFKSLLALIVCACISYVSYDYGKNKAELKYLSYLSSQSKQTVEAYQKLLNDERQARIEAERQSAIRMDTISSLRADADSLRMQLNQRKTECELRVSSITARSNTSAKTLNRRIVSLEELLKEATTLIEERDLIANDYNTLRSQCKLKFTNGNDR